MAVNLTGTFHCLQLAVPDMIAGGWGRIVTISSSSAQSGSRTQGSDDAGYITGQVIGVNGGNYT